MHMIVTDSDYSIFDGDQTLLARALVERRNPTTWPLSIDDLPSVCALVGGSVRDGLLNRMKPKPDLDIVVPSDAIKLAQQLASRLDATFVILDHQRDIARLVIDEWTIDFAKQTGSTLLEDLYRRDFTINAIALKFYPIPMLIDPSGGL